MSADPAKGLDIRFVEHGRIDSTMKAALADPGPAPAIHRAESQSAGRGRRGRTWESPPGNLYATIRWPEREEPFPPGLMGAIQIEWARVIRGAGGPEARCKWPNDGWLGGAKWSGLLAVRPAGRPGEIHVGLGANLTSAPEIADSETTDLRSHWASWPGAGPVAEWLIDAAVAVLADGPRGVASRLAEWSRHDALEAGTPLVVEGAGGRRIGTYLGIDADGRLRLGTNDGEARFASGEAHRVRRV